MLLAACMLSSAAAQEIHLYIAAGQSNMVGLGAFRDPAELKAHERIQYRIRNLWGNKDPEWTAIPRLREKDGKVRGVGPWYAFSREMAAASPEAEIRILMLAVSGSPLRKWVKGGDFFDEDVRLIKKATGKDVVLKGMIRHQGQAGTGYKDGTGPAYDELFTRMVSDYKEALGVKKLPVVAGTIAKTGKGGAVNKSVEKLKKTLDDYALPVTTDRVLYDHVHYDADTCDAPGKETARQMRDLLSKKRK
jgi:hypothetical protein